MVMTARSLAELMKQRREKADLTQEQLAEKSGIARTTISAIEQGRIKQPQSAILKALVKHIPMTMDEASAAMGYASESPDADDLQAEWEKWEADLEALVRYGRTLMHRRLNG